MDFWILLTNASRTRRLSFFTYTRGEFCGVHVIWTRSSPAATNVKRKKVREKAVLMHADRNHEQLTTSPIDPRTGHIVVSKQATVTGGFFGGRSTQVKDTH
jgi:hypothetical protein